MPFCYQIGQENLDIILQKEWNCMEFLLDTADIKLIKELNSVLKIDGVTTNPTILSKANKKFESVIPEITEILGVDVPIHVQVLSTNYDDMVKEALHLNELRKNLYIKIPVTFDGYKAIKILSSQNINVTATTVFTVSQGIMAARVGAKYIAPYVNRIDNLAGDGVSVVRELVKILELYHMEAKVLAASFKNTQQIMGVWDAKVHSLTVNPDLIKGLISHPSTDLSVTNFTKDWQVAFAKGSKSGK
jgi:fructose-6-phosphate aldolase 2